MTELMSAEYELDVLNAFIAAVERPDAPLDDMLEAAQDHAYAFRTRLETPVRVAFTGLRGSGKSGLINLLVGQEILPSGRSNFSTPAIIVRHSTTEKTIAGWWDRPNEEIIGIDLGAAFSRNPDVVSIEIDCEVLKDIWLIDISGLGDPEHNKRAIFALMRLADVMLWCSNVKDPSPAAEGDSWRAIPGRLMRNSLRVLTHPDATTEQEIASKSTLGAERTQSFVDTIPVATVAAMQALRGMSDDPAATWQDSGADNLVNAVMTAAVSARAAELEKARRGIARFIAPAQDKLDAFFGVKTVIERRAAIVATEVEVDAIIPTTKAPAVTAAVPSPEPVAPAVPAARSTSIFPTWLDKIAAIRADLESGSVSSNSEFIQIAQQTVDDFRDYLENSNELPGDAGWLVDEFEKANDLLILLQFETADDVAIDAARVLAQLSESLHTAGA